MQITIQKLPENTVCYNVQAPIFGKLVTSETIYSAGAAVIFARKLLPLSDTESVTILNEKSRTAAWVERSGVTIFDRTDCELVAALTGGI